MYVGSYSIVLYNIQILMFPGSYEFSSVAVYGLYSLCNTLTPQIKGMPEPISHIYIALPTSLKNLVIGNGGNIFLYTPSWRVYIFHVHSPFLITTCLIHLQALMLYLN